MDLEKAKTALRNAHAAGDVESARKIAGYLKAQQTQPTAQPVAIPEDKNFFQRVGDDYTKRVGIGQQSADAYVSGKQSLPETMLQQGFNMGVALGSDVIGQGLVSAGRGLNNITFGGAGIVGKNVLDYVANSPVGDAAKYIGNQYSNFATENPRAARNVNAVGNLLGVAGAFTPIKGGVSAVGAAEKGLLAGTKATKQGAKAVGSMLAYPVVKPVKNMLESVAVENLDDYGLELAKKARDIGIQIPMDAIAPDGALKTLGQVAQSTPFSGVKSIDKDNLQKWSNAVGRTIGSDKPINTKVLSEAKTRFNAQFDKIETGRNIPVSSELIAGIEELKNIANNASTVDVQNVLLKRLDDIENNLKIDKDLPFYLNDPYDLQASNIKSEIPVETLASLRKNAGELSSKASNYEISSALGDVEGFLTDKIIDSLDDVSKADYQDLKRQYRSFIAIKKAVKLDPENALSSPSKLLNSVATVYKDFPTGGGGELGDLARIGKQFVSPRAQGSNTFDKFLTMGAVASVLNPIAMGAAGAAVTGGRIAKNALYNQDAIDSAIKKGMLSVDDIKSQGMLSTKAGKSQ